MKVQTDDRCLTVSVWTLATYVAWLVTFVAVAFAVLHDGACEWLPGPLSAIAATLSIRGFSVRLGSNIRNAFELGRDVGRSEVVEMRR